MNASSSPRQSTSRWVGPLFAAALLALLALSWRRDSASTGVGRGDDVPFLARVNVGDPAPAFQATTLSGREVSFPADYHGKLVLLDFWATWCGPCRREFPHLREAYTKFHDRGFEILAVSLDEPRGVSKKRVATFLVANNADWPIVYANVADVVDAYRVRAIPTPFLIDGDTGIILARDEQLRGNSLAKTIDSALKKK